MDGTIVLPRMIGFSAVVSKKESIPRSLMALPQKERKPQTGSKSGEKPSPNDVTENCSLEMINMLSAGYSLVDAFWQEFHDGKLNRVVYRIQFWFARNEFDTSADEFREIREGLYQSFLEVCQGAFWRVKTFVNSFYENNVAVLGQSAMSFVMEARRPRYKPDGSPEVQWQKDENGERIGNSPIPIFPDYYLVVGEGGVSFEPRED